MSDSPVLDAESRAKLIERFWALGLDVAEYEHKQLADDWKLIDSKAQAATAIAGVLLAACLVFVKSSTHNLGTQERFLLVLLLFVLVAAILFAIWCMKRRDVDDPLTGSGALAMIKQAILKPNIDRRYTGMQSDILEQWSKANDNLRKVIKDEKAHWLFLSQLSLMLAAMLTLTLLIVAISK